LGVDAAIIFSDILVVPEAMGLPYEMIESKGPYFPEIIKSAHDIDKLRVPDPEEALAYVTDAIRLTKKELDQRVPLIGFAGAPWTIFCYMTEGKGSKEFATARRWIMAEPVLARRLLDRITEMTSVYLKSQIAAGADMIQLFDSWAGVLGPETYREFAIPCLKRICDDLKDEGVPITLFSKGAHFAIADLAALPCNTLGIDWTTDIAKARIDVGSERTLQGNLDPAVLYAEDEKIVKETQLMLSRFGKRRHIANLGHGVYPDTAPEKVKLFIETVKGYRHDV
jgi:uroporphyrinogen decarboxylase